MANPPAKNAPAAPNQKAANQNSANKNPKNQAPKENSIQKVLERLRTCDNVLITLSKNPTIDELTAALGFTYILDKVGKHATAIFSGAIPNVIEFLEPEKTFEQDTNSLQDFIVAINKEKADHLRYKIEGDYVKVFITPYKTTITEADMEFSHGDYNVDLVVALNVASEEELDAALVEYGRIMHDASSINITAGAPQKFGDIEWSDPDASSISEMIARLASHIRIEGVEIFDRTIATTLLTGIIAATNRFSNEHTSSETMAISAKLLAAGADQQLISSNVPVDILTPTPEPEPAPAPEPEPTPAADDQYDNETVLSQDFSNDENVADIASRATERAKAADAARRQEAEAKAAAIKAAKEQAAAADPTALSIDHSNDVTTPPELPATPVFDAPETQVPVDANVGNVSFDTSAQISAIEEKVRSEMNPSGAVSESERVNASVNALDSALASAAAAAPISPAAVVADKVNVSGTAVPTSAISAAAAQAVPQLASGGIKHVLNPLDENDPEQAKAKPKDYSALMDAELNDESIRPPVAPEPPAAPEPPVASIPAANIEPPAAPAPTEAPAPVAAPAPEPTAPAVPEIPVVEAPAPAAPEPATAPEAVATPPHIPTITELFGKNKKEAAEKKPEPKAEEKSLGFVPLENLSGEIALPLPDPDQILPPPPMPFEPSAAPAVPEAAPQSAGQAPIGEVSSLSDDADPQLPVVPIQPATLTKAGDDQPKSNPTSEVYPDPSAFKIPGL